MAHEGMEGTGHPAKHLRDGHLRTLDTFFFSLDETDLWQMVGRRDVDLTTICF